MIAIILLGHFGITFENFDIYMKTEWIDKAISIDKIRILFRIGLFIIICKKKNDTLYSKSTSEKL